MKILHLASWYPDRIDHFTGDFIQRHLKAISLFMPVTVIHIAQYGGKKDINTDYIDNRLNDNLTEKIIQFRFRRTGFILLDKARYNRIYYRCYKKIIKEYFNKNGKPELVHVHVPMKAGVIATWLKKKYDIPYIVSEHSSSYYDFIPGNYFSRSVYYRNTVKKIFRDALCTTVVSKKIGEKLQEIFGFKNLSVIHNTVDSSSFHFSSFAPEKFRFIHASTMNHPKNVEGILRCLARLKTQTTNWECIMLGWETDGLKKLSADLQLDEFVKWNGVVSYPAVAEEMQKSSALVMFSRYENFPCTIIEALCCGLPVIATNVGGVAEAVNIHNGILVESENEDQLFFGLQAVMEKYPSFDRKKIAEDAQNKFSYNIIGKQFLNLYQQLLSPKQ